MTENTYNVIKPDNGVPTKAWIKGVPLEDAARRQLLNRMHFRSIASRRLRARNHYKIIFVRKCRTISPALETLP